MKEVTAKEVNNIKTMILDMGKDLIDKGVS